jgi:hypothetical protein
MIHLVHQTQVRPNGQVSNDCLHTRFHLQMSIPVTYNGQFTALQLLAALQSGECLVMRAAADHSS